MTFDLNQITSLATSALPFVLNHLEYIRGKLADSSLSEAGKAIVALLKDKWLAKSETAQASVKDLEAAPNDTDNQEAVVLQLKKALKADPEFAAELQRLLAPTATIQQNASIDGDQNKQAQVAGQGNTTVIS